MYLGCHLSSSQGYLHMAQEAVSIGADTFQFFTRNPRGGAAKPIDPKDTEAFMAYTQEHHFGPCIAHAPYTLNACSKDASIRDFARRTMLDDLERLEYTPGMLYNFHPGSHVGQGTEAGIQMIADQLSFMLEREWKTTILLETMAGKGSEVGSRFEEIREIIDRTRGGEKLGVCMDTCHINDAGYDVVNDLDAILAEFDRVVGMDRLKALHINDSKNPFASHKDRHEKIGEGSIGMDAIVRVITHPALCHLPMVLETPNELDGYQKEIALLRGRVQA